MKKVKKSHNPMAVELYRNGLFKEKSTPTAYENSRRVKKFDKRKAMKFGKDYEYA